MFTNITGERNKMGNKKASVFADIADTYTDPGGRADLLEQFRWGDTASERSLLNTEASCASCINGLLDSMCMHHSN